MPFETLAIPAKAGIQPVDGAFAKVRGVDSRFRGNDWCFEMDPMTLLPAAGMACLPQPRLGKMFAGIYHW
jgi:hypothetical protein